MFGKDTFKSKALQYCVTIPKKVTNYVTCYGKNKPQAEGRVNHVCTEEHRRSSTLFSFKKTMLVYLKSCLLINMVELDQRSAANTSVNKMGLDACVLFNIFNYCRFVSYSVLINLDEY